MEELNRPAICILSPVERLCFVRTLKNVYLQWNPFSGLNNVLTLPRHPLLYVRTPFRISRFVQWCRN